jgi:predicted ATPase/DNA-binding SARP family transcriptional activator
VRIGLLGPVEVVAGADGAVVGLGGQRLRAVLARLALDPDRVVTVDALVDAVWGDDPPAGSVNALQSLVSRLRRALPAGTVLSVPAGYRLAVDPESVDACRFERLAAAGRRALADDDPARAADELREALALWRGPALADIGEAPFRAAVAVRLENTRLAALEDRIDADLTLGRHADVIPELEALTAANPLRERPFALLMLALNGASQQAEALATYDRIRRRLADELGMDPGPVLVAAQASVLNGQPAGPSRPSSNGRQLPAPRSNLRPQLTSFVGRADELDRIAALLRDERLVTLVGPGGAGKTRLAEESGSRLTGTHSGGVWMIPLAPVGDGGELDQALLTSLGRLSFTQLERSRTLELGPPDLHEKVVKALSSGPTLLVLDNCEHLIESIAELAHELLLDCPQLRILATSREPLGVPGERLHPVPSLEVPPANVTSPADALHFSAVQLLVDRAVAVRPEFKLDEQNVRAVVDICHRLDGMPLALELAAARFRSLGPEQVAARLGDRFRLLTGGSRTVLPRHQTLRAVVAWSWELLKPAEQALWRRLSVFPAGVSLDAAEQVCADVELGPEEMLDTLASLVDKSLVELAGDDANPRYRMLETMRAYGAERLTEAGETERLRDTQMAYYLELVETNEPKLRTSEQGAWIAQLTIDYENIIAALRWAIDTQRADPAIRIIGGLTWYLSLRGAHREALRWASAALAMPGESSPVAHAIVRAFAALAARSSPSPPTRTHTRFWCWLTRSPRSSPIRTSGSGRRSDGRRSTTIPGSARSPSSWKPQ